VPARDIFLLNEALLRAGSKERLASRIGLTRDEIDCYLSGEAILPVAAMIKLIDVISPGIGRRTREAGASAES